MFPGLDAMSLSLTISQSGLCGTELGEVFSEARLLKMCTQMHVYAHRHTHTNLHMHTGTHTNSCMQMHTHVHTHECTHMHTHIHVHAQMHTHTHMGQEQWQLTLKPSLVWNHF